VIHAEAARERRRRELQPVLSGRSPPGNIRPAPAVLPRPTSPDILACHPSPAANIPAAAPLAPASVAVPDAPLAVAAAAPLAPALVAVPDVPWGAASAAAPALAAVPDAPLAALAAAVGAAPTVAAATWPVTAAAGSAATVSAAAAATAVAEAAAATAAADAAAATAAAEAAAAAAVPAADSAVGTRSRPPGASAVPGIPAVGWTAANVVKIGSGSQPDFGRMAPTIASRRLAVGRPAGFLARQLLTSPRKWPGRSLIRGGSLTSR
jgi:hypothetical protein